MKRIITIALLAAALPSMAQERHIAEAPQKLIFMPDSLKPYDFNDDNARWCWRHSSQTQNVIFLWEKPFGDDTRQAPTLDGQPMSFDLGNLQTRVEHFYRFFQDTLKFSLPGSICDKYKMMVMINYSLEGTAYGGTYDDFIGAMWVTPNRIQDKRLNCLAHELGHSFQLQIIADRMGEAWGGSGFYEMTSQWMLWRVNPDWITDEKYHFDAFSQLTHKGFLHLENIYHSPYVIEWWAEKHGLESIAQLYREGKRGEDPVVTYKRMYNMSQKQFNDEIFDCYRHLVNFDLAYARKSTRPYACTFDTKVIKQENGWLRPDTALIPENYGFNAIRLQVPEQGRKVTVNFRALDMEGKPLTAGRDKMARTIGYRYALVGVTDDTDECIYSPVCEAMKGEVTLEAPKSHPLKALYLVVMGAPANHSLDPSSRLFNYEFNFRK